VKYFFSVLKHVYCIEKGKNGEYLPFTLLSAMQSILSNKIRKAKFGRLADP
jgi:hypothetical protein